MLSKKTLSLSKQVCLWISVKTVSLQSCFKPFYLSYLSVLTSLNPPVSFFFLLHHLLLSHYQNCKGDGNTSNTSSCHFPYTESYSHSIL